MKFPLVSVVMPTKNYGRYIAESTSSLCEQTVDDIEIIIVDDGSTDDTKIRVGHFQDKRIKYFGWQESRGNFAARNYGMKQAVGKYICVMDADDVCFPGRLESQVAYLEARPEIGLIGAQAKLMDAKGTKGDTLFSRPVCSWSLMRTLLLLDSKFIHPTVFMNRKLLLDHCLFYNEGFPVAGDYDFLVRCADRFPVQNMEDPLLYYRIHPAQISIDKRKEQIAYADMIRLEKLKSWLPDATEMQQHLYLNAMKRAPFCSENDIQASADLFEAILKANTTRQSYVESELYMLFDYLLEDSIDRYYNETKIIQPLTIDKPANVIPVL